ncbi:MAG: hypothetical protein R3245_05130, partial [Kiloniellales bacterium]|nr:hypothetical protein [Kiloniellales bacterium]
RIGSALALSQELGHSGTLGDTLSMCVLLAAMLRDDLALQDPMAALVEVASSENLQNYLALARTCQGSELLLAGQKEEGLAFLNEALPHLLGSEFAWFAPLVTEAISALGKSGSHDEARALIERTLEIAEEKGTTWWLAELHRVRGELALGHDAAKATASFQTAIEIAGQQGARLLELRAAASLAELWRCESRIGEAKALLGAIYEQFTEGHGTADLKSAKTLLATLDQTRSGPSSLGF